MLFHGLRKLAGAGIAEIAVVTNREDLEEVRATVQAESWEAELRFLPQAEPGGIPAAMALARSFVGDSPFVVLLGDNLFQSPLGPVRVGHEASGAAASAVLAEVADCRDLGVARLEGGEILALEEKPAGGGPGWAVTGIYFLASGAFPRIAALSPSQRGELEILELLEGYRLAGRLGWQALPGWWIDAGTPAGLDWARATVQAHPPLF